MRVQSKMKKKLILTSINLIVILIALLIPFFIYTNNIEKYVFDLNFYEKQYEINNVNEANQTQVTKEMFNYFRNKDSLIKTDTFNPKEKHHLNEVKVLLNKLFDLKKSVILGLIGLFSILFFLSKEEDLFLRKSAQAILGSSIIILVSILLGLLLFADFSSSFFNFHTLIFDSNTWILNPETDLMIRLFPEPFFVNITKGIFLRTALQGFSLMVLALTFIYSSSKSIKKHYSPRS